MHRPASAPLIKPRWPVALVLSEDMMPDWHLTFVDYLFLAFTAATAFSPTDTLPLPSWASC